MQSYLLEYIFLVLIILGLVMLAQKLRVAYPIVVVLGGLALSFTSAFSDVAIDPELVFFIFLPPLLYEAAWQVSWKEFWRWRRVIMSFAFPIVILTACVVALVSRTIIPGFTLALGFLLGGIISPPDAVSASAIMRYVKVPKSLAAIIQGESLLNDASSLIVFRFALAAVVTGQFYFGQAATNFSLVIAMGTLIGLLVGLIFYAIHRWLPTTPGIDIVLTLVTPYCMYFAAEHFHFSGVLAVVSGGLLLSIKRHSMLTYESRIQGVNVWTNLVFVLNGLIFLLIGLQLPTITRQLGDIGLGTAIGYGLAISLTLVIARLLCAYGAVFITRFMSRFITVADPNPGWKGPTVLGWAGMRGVVSLAAALSIPLYLAEGVPFPYRNLILFITFIVILVTLVLQGLSLPWLIRKMDFTNLNGGEPGIDQERVIEKKLALASVQFLEERYGSELAENPRLKNLHTKLQIELEVFGQSMQDGDGGEKSQLNEFWQIYLQLLERQRHLLQEMNRHAEVDEDLIRKYTAMVDMEELKARERVDRAQGV